MEANIATARTEWEMKTDNAGRTYYENHSTRQTQWEPPNREPPPPYAAAPPPYAIEAGSCIYVGKPPVFVPSAPAYDGPYGIPVAKPAHHVGPAPAAPSSFELMVPTAVVAPQRGGTHCDPWEQFSWASLPRAYKNNWITIGYTERSWDGVAPPPRAISQEFQQLSREQQQAAHFLGYSPQMWNNDIHPNPLPSLDFSAGGRGVTTTTGVTPKAKACALS